MIFTHSPMHTHTHTHTSTHMHVLFKVFPKEVFPLLLLLVPPVPIVTQDGIRLVLKGSQVLVARAAGGIDTAWRGGGRRGGREERGEGGEGVDEEC